MVEVKAAPGRTTNRSPTTTRSTGTRTSRPARTTDASVAASPSSASRAAPERGDLEVQVRLAAGGGQGEAGRVPVPRLGRAPEEQRVWVTDAFSVA